MSTLEEKVMASMATRKLTFEVLELAKNRDPVDAIKDVAVALEVLKERWNQMLQEEGLSIEDTAW